MKIFDEVNKLTEEEIAAAAGLQRADDGESWVSPCCGNGSTGGKGNGIRQKIYRGRLAWHCYRCGEHMSNCDVIAAAYRIPTTNAAELAQKLEELFPKMKSGKDFFLEGKNFTKESARTTTNETKRKNYSRMYEVCRRALPNFLATVGGTWRGLTNETLREAGAGYNAKYKSVVMPYDDFTYFWREVEGSRRAINPGGKRRLYYPSPAAQIKIGQGTVNFLTEGEIDALSVKQALRNDLRQFGVAATGSVSFVRKTIEELNVKFGACAEKPKFIWLGDNDESGREGAKKYVEGLKAAGYPAVAVFFADDGQKVDANQYLQEHGTNGLYGFLVDVEDAKDRELDEQAEEIRRSLAEAVAKEANAKFFSLKDYLSNDFDNELDRMKKYSDRATGFDNLDAAQIFLPGLYVLGGTPGSGKTTFALQLLSQLAEGDEYRYRAPEYCVLCSYEMTTLELTSRLIAREMRRRNFANKGEGLAVSSADIRLGHGRDTEEFRNAKQKVLNTSGHLHILELSNTPLDKLISFLEGQAKLVGDKPMTIAIDYLQLIPVADSKATAKERIDEVMLSLKTFQRATGATLILVSSLNRNSCIDGGKDIFSFKESGAIEYSADVTWKLFYEADKNELPRYVTLICGKNRNGAPYRVYFDYWAQSDYFCGCKERPVASSGDDGQKKKSNRHT